MVGLLLIAGWIVKVEAVLEIVVAENVVVGVLDAFKLYISIVTREICDAVIPE